MDGVTVVVGLIMLVGLVGIVVPVLPGLLLVWAAVLVWACATQTRAGWVALGVATTLALSGVLLQHLLAGRHMAQAQDSGHSALVLVRSGPGFDLVAQDEVGARVERVCGGEVLAQLGDRGGGASGW